ncbi:ribonuclease HII [Peptoniphilus stercorisuis]|uniref:Ribonuclease HII n=1 Tax=Peptoniphilus stercorisuis TaxID=1436965 RepID=A0ABS4KD03_9FIRM|nr:ribonuclease HII [Peptoniphilus stercorisuis]MBP2025146.1 ribonuclease HII [Peptoniphilus stercorisuis]
MHENFEEQYSEKGYKFIAGIDEVGRGALFGDVLACAIIMPVDEEHIDGIKDSKKLSEKKRERFYEEILNESVAIGIGRVEPEIIDQINIKEATHLAMLRAIENLRDSDGNKIVPDILLIDAETINTDIEQVPIIKGDDKCYTISCASIVAKVYRDRLCQKWAKRYENYGIEKHKGYGTKLHRDAIKAYGPSEMHRLSFLKNRKEW